MLRVALAAVALTGCHLVFPLEEFVRGPVGYYSFEGDVLADSSGGEHHGSCVINNCPVRVAGRVGSGARFDGDDLIDVPHDPDFMTIDAVTVTFWMQLDGQTPGCPVNKLYGPDEENAWQLCIQGDGSAFFFSAGAEAARSFGGDSTQWHHFAMRWDGRAQFKSLWIDGLVVNGLVSPLPIDGMPLVFGADR
ncbi:MAG TPA: LamG-like jellyroll fold domain-containing protein, partial [Kofleriaceae bacterium]